MHTDAGERIEGGARTLRGTVRGTAHGTGGEAQGAAQAPEQQRDPGHADVHAPLSKATSSFHFSASPQPIPADFGLFSVYITMPGPVSGLHLPLVLPVLASMWQCG